MAISSTLRGHRRRLAQAGAAVAAMATFGVLATNTAMATSAASQPAVRPGTLRRSSAGRNTTSLVAATP